MSLLPFLALYLAVVFAPMAAAVRDLMVHQIRIERTRAVLNLALRDGAQMSAPDETGRLRGDPAAMVVRVAEIWAGARIPDAVLEEVSCVPVPPACAARARVTTRGFLGTLSTRVAIEGTVLEGILREGQ
ncbi:hypothetical protein [Thermoflexus hugenholtzii]|uniref:TadE-like protein n=1 Tax=Thermoflexus hugenholtzii JAD2 TaxID=877466 RepID=A0A212QL77_9CHLR|nr:hypothetical protein [Thermoflexus hugenholtzii]SNB60163.1 hypothetical protein SAMN02746019_00003200 [Thermoflexus hugenholtzii JAD2]